MYFCDRFSEERRIIELELGLRLSPENIMETLIASEVNLNKIPTNRKRITEIRRTRKRLKAVIT